MAIWLYLMPVWHFDLTGINIIPAPNKMGRQRIPIAKIKFTRANLSQARFMDSNSSFSSEFFFRLALLGAALVIIGVALEAAELIVKLGNNAKYGKWVGKVFGKSWRIKIARFAKFIHPRILPFEAVGFGLLFGGLAIELMGSFVAERIQAAENLKLQNRVEVLRKANDELEAAAKDRTITIVQSNLFMLLTKDLPKTKIKVFVGIHDYETDRFAKQIYQLLNVSGYGFPNEGIVYQPEGMVNFTNELAGRFFSTNDLAFMIYRASDVPDGFIPLGSAFTNDPALYTIQKFWRAKEAFEGIGLSGIFFSDKTVLKAGEAAIIVPPKKH